MSPSSLIGLVNNAALLLALGVLYDMMDSGRPDRGKTFFKDLALGMVIGFVGIAIMLNPWDFGRGVVFDSRSVLLCITGFFFGPFAALPAMAITAVYRLSLGGNGAYTGVGVIVTSGLIGILWRRFRRKPPEIPTLPEIYLMGIVVHLVMLAWMFTLPLPVAQGVLTALTLPVMLIYPSATAGLGQLMINREHRKASQEALRESETKFRNLFQNHSAVKLIIDPPGGRIVEANEAAAKFYGWTADQLKTMRIQDINALSEQEVQAEMERAVNQKRIHFEFRHRLADGSSRYVEVYTSKIRINDKEQLHSIIHDITDKKLAEEKLRESEDYQRAMISASPLAIISLTPEGRVRSWNKAAGNMFGWTEPEVIGNPLPIVAENNQEAFAALRKMVMKGESISMVELRLQRKDGSPVDINLSTAPLRGRSGEISGIMAVLEDITERKKSEREKDRLNTQLLQARKMESVGRLAGGVAHDYNNMLSVILGYTELGMEKLGPDDPLLPDLKEILKAARRSSDITRQLLAFSRQQTIAPRPLNLNEAVENMLKMLKRLIGEDIDLSWKPASHPCPISMDPSQLDQILINLCVNARDAIEDVGKITIETGTETFDKTYCSRHAGFSPGDFVFLSVSDDGCGMDKDTQQNLFEPFFTTKKSGQGTGLGLSTVYGVVLQNKGFINVYSEPGMGSTFKIYLPRHLSEGIVPPGPFPLKVDRPGTETILLVEDENTILQMTTLMLKRLGYTVLPAGSPELALDIVRTHDKGLDLLITDVVMPEMNGRELASRIQAVYPDIPVLFMSGYTADVIAHRGVLDQGVNFIQKPFSKKELAVKIRDVMGDSTPRTA